MGRVLDKILLHCKSPVNSVEHQIEIVCQYRQLIARYINFNTLIEVILIDALHLPESPVDAPAEQDRVKDKGRYREAPEPAVHARLVSWQQQRSHALTVARPDYQVVFATLTLGEVREEADMQYTLTCDGIPVGFCSLVGGPRAAGALFTMPAFEASGVRSTAQQLGVALRLIGWRRVKHRVAARALAGALARAAGLEPRLGLIDERGSTAAVRRIVTVEFPGASTPIVVVVLREQTAGIGAEPARWAAGPGEASRPAA